MKTKILLAAACLLLAACAKRIERQPPDTKRLGLKDRVSTVTAVTYHAVATPPHPAIAHRDAFMPGKEVSAAHIRQIGLKDYRETLFFNRHGRIVETVNFDEGVVCKYAYDKYGRIAEERRHDRDSNMIFTSKSKYDRHGKRKEVIRPGGMWPLRMAVRYETRPDGGMKRITGNLSAVFGLLRTTREVVYDKGQIRSISLSGKEGLVCNAEMAYDDHGRMSHITTLDNRIARGHTTTAAYRYIRFDRHGNWTRRYIYVRRGGGMPDMNRAPDYISVREIGYYLPADRKK